MRDFDSIADQIQKGFHYWKLYIKDGYTKRSEGTNLDRENPTAESSIEELRNAIGYYQTEPSTLFYVQLLKSPTATGNAKTDPIPFVTDLDTYNSVHSAKRVQMSGGLGATSPGGIQQYFDSALSGLGLVQQQQNAHWETRLAMEREFSSREQKLNLQEFDLKQREEKLKEKEADLKELEKVFLSDAERVTKGTSEAFKQLFFSFFEPKTGLPAAAGSSAGQALAGALVEQTEQEKIIEETASFVAANVQDMDVLRGWQLITSNLVADRENPVFSSVIQKAKQIWLDQQQPPQ
jgi:hypothetical protein